MATKLQVYNNALMLLGERQLASLTENRKPRRLLDQAWDSGAVDACLELSGWTFATRALRLDHDTSLAPDFGMKYVFAHPQDYIQTISICADEMFEVPLQNYQDEGGYWFAHITPIYVRFVSNDDSYGNNIANWPSSFDALVSAYLANETCVSITQSTARQVGAQQAMKMALDSARGKDAIRKPSMRFPTGRLASSRLTGMGLRNNRPGYR